MTKANKYLEPVKVGDKVAFLVSEFDRGISDPPVILCKIYKIEKDLFILACEAGLIKDKLARNAFQFISQDVDFKVVNEPVMAVRSLVTHMSECGGQGFLKCGPNCKCNTKKCKCRAANVLCNSRCHAKKQTDCPNC